MGPLLYIQSDVPEGMTLDQYRDQRNRARALERRISGYYFLTLLWSLTGLAHVTRKSRR